MTPGFYIAKLEYWDEKTVVEIRKVGDEWQLFLISDDESYLLHDGEIHRRGSSDTMEIELLRKVEL